METKQGRHGASTLRALVARLPIAPGRRFARWLQLQTRDDLLEIGSDYGGWTVPAHLVDSDWTCICAGVGDDLTFDLGLIERFGCTVIALDPTPASARYVADLKVDEPGFRFLPIGLWSSDRVLTFYEPREGDSNYSALNLQATQGQIDGEVKSLRSLMGDLALERVDLLKLDIEGSEYEALAPVIDGHVLPTVICVEFHRVGGLGLIKRTVSALEHRGYRAVCRRGYDVTFVHQEQRAR